ncbi:MAG: response regulator transcription factor [Peptostreptococcaceae bacterium]
MTKILIVEDDSTIAFSMKYALESEGYKVESANNIEIARKKIKENKFDLLLLDVMLPDGTGYELCEEVRRSSEIPIIFLTACDEEVNVVMGLDIGGDDYITKPFRVRELMSRIKAVMRRKSPDNEGVEENSTLMRFGNLKISILEARVFKNDEEIFLTSVEYKLLLVLAQNKGIVLSRVQILEKLWDVSYDFVNDNTLTVYIKRLREKIEDEASSPKFILTARGIGYKFIGEN